MHNGRMPRHFPVRRLIAVLAASEPQAPDAYRARLADLEGLSHVTIEARRGALTKRPASV